MSKVCIDDKADLAREIYFACQELLSKEVDPTMPECEFIAEKILAKGIGIATGQKQVSTIPIYNERLLRSWMVENIISRVNNINDDYLCADRILDMLRPYLRTTGPVTVKEGDLVLVKNVPGFEDGVRVVGKPVTAEQPVGLTIDEIAIIISEWMAIDDDDCGIQNAAKRIHELSQPTKGG